MDQKKKKKTFHTLITLFKGAVQKICLFSGLGIKLQTKNWAPAQLYSADECDGLSSTGAHVSYKTFLKHKKQLNNYNDTIDLKRPIF